MRCSDVLYGNMYNHFIKGCDKERTLADRVTQFSLALLEAIPVIGQIISLIESLYFSDEVRPPAPPAPAPVSKEERADSPCARENAVPLYDRKSCVLNLKERPINALMDALNIVVSKPESGYRFELVEPKGSTLYAHVARQKGGVRTEKGFCISWQEIRALLDSYETITSPDDREGASVTAICGNIYVLGDGRGAEFARKVGDRDEIRMICMPKEGRVAGWDTIIRATNPGIVVISWMEGDSEK